MGASGGLRVDGAGGHCRRASTAEDVWNVGAWMFSKAKQPVSMCWVDSDGRAEVMVAKHFEQRPFLVFLNSNIEWW